MSVTDNERLQQFELMEDGKLALARYRRRAHSVEIPHVEADPALRGKGTANRLMEGIVALARKDGFSITPTCDYAKSWFARHKEAADVLA
jgi:predicted GNAT family acetyltransferase